MIEIKEAHSKKLLKAFIDFPYRLYQNDENYVPELRVTLREFFDKKRYPLFDHAETAYFLAYQNERVVGRIAALKNNRHIEILGEKTGFFGFFESIDDYAVTAALLNKAIEWLKGKGLTAIIGPENYTINDSVGFLVNGFENKPVFMMPYNKPYYPKFFERYGFKKTKDLYSYYIPKTKTPERIERIAQNLEKRLTNQGVIFRPMDFKNFSRETVLFRKVYNDSFESNWHALPLTEKEFGHQAAGLKQIADPELIQLAEKDGQLIGFVCTIPDINQILIKISNGRLLPFGLFRLLFGKRKITNLRVLIMGVTPEYRHRGVETVLLERLFRFARQKGIRSGEAAYVMDDNKPMINLLEKIGGAKRNLYRIYKYEF